MNIFILDLSIFKCAKSHVNRHVVKMCVEYGQLLSTAHRVLDNSRNKLLYKATHVNHPCALWVRQSQGNYLYLYRLLRALCREYTYRYHKVHKIEWSGLLKVLAVPPANYIRTRRTPFVQAMPKKYQQYDTVQAYRRYYRSKKRHLFKWTRRNTPTWI